MLGFWRMQGHCWWLCLSLLGVCVGRGGMDGSLPCPWGYWGLRGAEGKAGWAPRGTGSPQLCPLEGNLPAWECRRLWLLQGIFPASLIRLKGAVVEQRG